MLHKRETKSSTCTQQKMARPSATSFSKLMELRDAQLIGCSLKILKNVQIVVLGYDEHHQIRNAEQLTTAQLRALIEVALNSPGAFQNFCDRLAVDDECKHLPAVIVEICRANIEFHHLYDIALPTDPLRRLWVFVLRTCFEKLCLLNSEDDRQGHHLDMFRTCLLRFYAECLMHTMPSFLPSNQATRSSSVAAIKQEPK
jgi:hypothetical protein